MLTIKITKKEAIDIATFLKSLQVPATTGYNLVVIANLLENGEEISTDENKDTTIGKE